METDSVSTSKVLPHQQKTSVDVTCDQQNDINSEGTSSNNEAQQVIKILPKPIQPTKSSTHGEVANDTQKASWSNDTSNSTDNSSSSQSCGSNQPINKVRGFGDLFDDDDID